MHAACMCRDPKQFHPRGYSFETRRRPCNCSPDDGCVHAVLVSCTGRQVGDEEAGVRIDEGYGELRDEKEGEVK
jgi:hypothetical protein